MQFKNRNLRALADMVVGNAEYFPYRTSRFITEFFEDCDLDFVHDGSTRWSWAAEKLEELLLDQSPSTNELPVRFVHLLRVLMDKTEIDDECNDDKDRTLALESLNGPLKSEGFEAYYEDENLYIRHIGTKIVSAVNNPHRPFTPNEVHRRDLLIGYLDKCSEDELIEEVLLPMFRQLGFHRITAAGHKDKSLEYGKDIWMRYVLPTQHVLYFGIQVKKGKLNSSGVSKGSDANVAEIHNQVNMMLGHEIFDPEINKKVLVDHAFIVAGGEITKQAKNWLGEKLNATKRSQILFMDRDDILNLYAVNSWPLPNDAMPKEKPVWDAEIPF